MLGEGELEDRAADARDAGLGRFGHVALGQGPQGVEGRHQVADAAGQTLVADRPGRSTRRRSSPSRRIALEQVAHEGGAPLEGQRHHGDPPAVVLLADPVGHRHAYLVEEQFGESVVPSMVRSGRISIPGRPSA